MTFQSTSKAALQARIAATLTQFLLPIVFAIGAGIATNAFLPHWVSPWAIVLLVLTAATLFFAVRSKMVVAKIKLGAVLWTIASLALSCGAGYFQWQHLSWPVNPWLGAGAIGALWVVIFIGQVFLQGQKRHPANSIPASGNNRTPTGDDNNLNVIKTWMGQLGLPINNPDTVDLARLVNAMARQAESNATQADADLLNAAVEAVKQGVLNPDQLTARACQMLGIELPQPTIQPVSTPQSKILPRRQAVTIDWGRKKPTKGRV